MGDKDIQKALSLADILEGIRAFLQKNNNIEKLIDIGLINITKNKSSYSFESKKDTFKKYLLIDFQDIVQYTKEDDFHEETYFLNRKILKEFNTEYYFFYIFLSKYILTDAIHEHIDIKENLSFIFKTTFASKHKK